MTTFEKLRRVLAAAIGIEEAVIKPETRIRILMDRGAPDNASRGEVPASELTDDSLDLIEFTMLLEEGLELSASLGLTIPDAGLDELQRWIAHGTVQDLADFIDYKNG